MTDENGRIVYTTKELLGRLDQKLDLIDMKLDSKADRDRVHDLANRTAALELQAGLRARLVDEVRETQARVTLLETWRNRLAGGFAALSLVTAAGVWSILFH